MGGGVWSGSTSPLRRKAKMKKAEFLPPMHLQTIVQYQHSQKISYFQYHIFNRRIYVSTTLQHLSVSLQSELQTRRGIEDNSKIIFLFLDKNICCLIKTALIMGHNICLNGEIWLIIPELCLLSIFIWSIVTMQSDVKLTLQKVVSRNLAMFLLACLTQKCFAFISSNGCLLS